MPSDDDDVDAVVDDGDANALRETATVASCLKESRLPLLQS